MSRSTMGQGLSLGARNSRGQAALFNRTMVGLFLLGIHLNPFEAHQPIPFLLSMLAAGGLYLSHWRAIPVREARLLLIFLLIALACTILAPRPEYLIVRLRSWTYLAASVAAGFILFVELRRWPKARLARWAGAGAAFLLIGAGLEVTLDPVQRLVDAYRFWNFTFPYDNDARDLVYHGLIRPKFFSSEPSYLAKNFSFLLLMWLFVTAHRRRFLVFLLAGVMALLIIRSPILVSLPAGAGVYLVFGPAGGFFRRLSPALKFAGGALGGLLVIGLFAWASWDTVGARLMLIAAGDDASTTIRLWLSFAIIPDLLAFNPITGIGVGGTEAFARDVLASGYAGAWNGYVDLMIQKGTLEHVVQNFVANFVAAFGLVGGAVALFFLIRLQRLAAPRSALMFWPLFLLFALTTGALNGLVMWVIFFALFAFLSRSQTPFDSRSRSGCHGPVDASRPLLPDKFSAGGRGVDRVGA